MLNPKLTIAIVTHDQEGLVLSLLESLEKYQPDLDFEVLVLENTEVFPEKLEARYGDRYQIIQNENVLSLSENLNKLFSMSSGEYFCILNPDVYFFEEVFSGLLETMRTHDVDIIAPLVKSSDGQMQDSFRSIPRPWEIIVRRLFDKREQVKIDPDENGLMHPEWVAGIFLLMRSETFRRLNGYDEKFRLYFEDVEFCMRARMAGYALAVDAGYEIIHDARRESHFKPLYFTYHLSSAAKFFFSLDYLKFISTKKRRGK